MVVAFCVDRVKSGSEMNAALVTEAMNATLNRWMGMLDKAEIMRALSDSVYDNIRAKGGSAKRRVIDADVIAAAPADGRGLLSRHRNG